MARLLLLGVVVVIGVILSTRGVLGQATEAGVEGTMPGGKQIHEETNAEVNALGSQPSGGGLLEEYFESKHAITEIGTERYEAAFQEEQPEKKQTEIGAEFSEYGQEVTKIQDKYTEEKKESGQ